MIKMLKLLTKDKVLKHSWSAKTSSQTPLLSYRATNIRRHEAVAVIDLGLFEVAPRALAIISAPERLGVSKWACC